MMARLKGLSVRTIFSLRLMVICACGLLAIRPKSQNSNIRHDGTLSIRNFMLMLKKPMDPNLEPLNLYAPWFQWPWSGQSPKIQVCNDGALSIRKLILNKVQLIISLFLNWRTTKKCAPYFRGNTEFPIYLNGYIIKNRWKLSKILNWVARYPTNIPQRTDDCQTASKTVVVAHDISQF
jgi:hypothetical protein